MASRRRPTSDKAAEPLARPDPLAPPIADLAGNQHSRRPSLNRSLSSAYERVLDARDEMTEWTSAWTLFGVSCAIDKATTQLTTSLIDTFETFFDSHVDLLQRRLQKQGDKLRSRADQLGTSLKLRRTGLSRDALSENFDREVKRMKLKV
jgi:hypothetical protein